MYVACRVRTQSQLLREVNETFPTKLKMNLGSASGELRAAFERCLKQVLILIFGPDMFLIAFLAFPDPEVRLDGRILERDLHDH